MLFANYRLNALLIFLLLSVGAFAAPSFQARRAEFKTKLLKVGPSPQSYENEALPRNVIEVRYPSAGRELKGWLYRPEISGARPRPVLVYFHGGFAFGASDLADCKRFIDAGFIVFTPTLRGENGNPGTFEMCLGEVDDARAAIKWISQQDYVDKKHIYTFGHSAGGMISALVSLFNDVDVRLTGSSGGLYGRKFYEASELTPFDKSDPDEFRFRSLIGNVSEMVHQHYAYVGAQDSIQEARSAIIESPKDSKLHVQTISGDHFSCLTTSFDKFYEVVLKDLKTNR